MEVIPLKGGSLSSTYKITDDSKTIVRKEVSLLKNREFGFQRWYSQLKKLQRFETQFPGLYPKVLDFGKKNNKAYFDIEYIQGSKNSHDFLLEDPPLEEIKIFLSKLVEAMDKMHSTTIESYKKSLDLYVYEEVTRRIETLKSSPDISNFFKFDSLIFNGKKVRSFIHIIDSYLKFGKNNYISPKETFTHGNITLENTLYIPNERKVVFIDPYEENIIDCIYNEYSQVLQSSNSKYEIYNQGKPVITGNKISMKIPQTKGLDTFNSLFKDFLNKRLTKSEINLVKFYEISQYLRMLPFQIERNVNKAIYFYGLASYLYSNILD